MKQLLSILRQIIVELYKHPPCNCAVDVSSMERDRRI